MLLLGSLQSVTFFNSYLQRSLGVPVGLINNAWGGSAAEAWVPREALEQTPRFMELVDYTRQREAYLSGPEANADYTAALQRWEDAGKKGRQPWSPEKWLNGNHRAGNLFAGMMSPIIGYGIKGAIWYQGEANADRAAQYADLFPFMISQWRDAWGQGDFPFYWVQLADFMAESPLPQESAWAELRDAQTQTLALPRTGQAVIVDLGEGRDIHPRRKHDVGARLARIALAQDYGFDLGYLSPRYDHHEIDGAEVTVTFDCAGGALRPFDTRQLQGFAVCGEDRVWHWAEGEVVGKNQVVLLSDAVSRPVAVRYGWADNPVCNLYSEDGLPAIPFRTDDFPLGTADNETPVSDYGTP